MTFPSCAMNESISLLETVKRTDENAIRQHGRENSVMKINETIQTDRERSKNDDH